MPRTVASNRTLVTLLTIPGLALMAGCYSNNPLDPDDPAAAIVDGEYVVGMRTFSGPGALAAVAARHGLQVAESDVRAGLAVLVDPQLRDRAGLLEALATSSDVAFAEPSVQHHLLRTPDDYGEYLWGFHNTGLNGGRAGADVSAFDAWDRSTGEGVVVAIIDTGVDTSHPDLRPNLWVNTGEIAGNGRDDDGNGYVDDVHGFDFVFRDGEPEDNEGHGTHVAGTVAAAGDDGYGVPGMAFDARIMAIKLLDPSGGGGSYQAAEAIRYAVDSGADVINASWGSYGYSSAVIQAVQYANSRGVVFVAAAGNEGSDNDQTPLYPASYDVPNVIAVAASDRRDRLASFSNTGASRVDLAAPGVQIVSTWPGGGWEYLDGTSMASPMVAGAAALLVSAAPSLTVSEVRQTLMATVDPLASGGSRVASGGRLRRWPRPGTPGRTNPTRPSSPACPPSRRRPAPGPSSPSRSSPRTPTPTTSAAASASRHLPRPRPSSCTSRGWSSRRTTTSPSSALRRAPSCSASPGRSGPWSPPRSSCRRSSCG